MLADTLPTPPSTDPQAGAAPHSDSLDLQLHDYPGPLRTGLFGLQHVLVMFSAMVGAPLILAKLLNLPDPMRNALLSGTMFACGIATITSALGLGFIGPRLPIVMGVFYVFIGPLVAISKQFDLATAMFAVMLGGLVQFAWSPLVARLHRYFPPIVTGTTILLIGTGLMKLGTNVAVGAGTPGFGKPMTLGLAALMIVLILGINRFGTGIVRALSLFLSMVIGYVVAYALGAVDVAPVGQAEWFHVPTALPYGAPQWPGFVNVLTIVVCFFVVAIETTGHTFAVSRICGVPPEQWRVRGAIANDGFGSVLASLFGGMSLTSYTQNIGVISLTGVGSRFVVAFGGVFLVLMALVPKVAAVISLLPNGVLGGVLLFMFATVASVGVDIISRSMAGRREMLIMSASLAVGLGIQAAPPGSFDAVPQAIRIVVSDGIVMGILLAMGLNLLLPSTDPATERPAPAH